VNCISINDGATIQIAKNTAKEGKKKNGGYEKTTTSVKYPCDVYRGSYQLLLEEEEVRI